MLNRDEPAVPKLCSNVKISSILCSYGIISCIVYSVMVKTGKDVGP